MKEFLASGRNNPLARATPWLMGILNVTPDSFFDGGCYADRKKAVEHALRLVEEGADAVDVGGESSRPGSSPVSEEEETRRVLPVIEALAGRLPVPISVDTTKAGVARRAFEAGASILNDISALRGDPAMAELAASWKAPLILVHMQGQNPRTMQENPRYENVVDEILFFLGERIRFFKSVGGDAEKIIVDPGIGFGKKPEHNLDILRGVDRFKSLERPLLVGASRKSFIGHVLGHEDSGPQGRWEGSLAVACWAAAHGVEILRVHDVESTRRALKVWAALAAAKGS